MSYCEAYCSLSVTGLWSLNCLCFAAVFVYLCYTP